MRQGLPLPQSLKHRSGRARPCPISSAGRPPQRARHPTIPDRRRPSRPARSRTPAHHRFRRRGLPRLPGRHRLRPDRWRRSALPYQDKPTPSRPPCLPRAQHRGPYRPKCRRPLRGRLPRQPRHVRPCRRRPPPSRHSHRLGTPRRCYPACRPRHRIRRSRDQSAHSLRAGALQSRPIRCRRCHGCLDSNTTGSRHPSGLRPRGTSPTWSSRRTCNPRRVLSLTRIPGAAVRPATRRHLPQTA
jgi:hypothetical protein